MSPCRRYQELIEDFVAGQITADDQADLDEHCAACAECAGLLDLHRNLARLSDEIPMPDRQALGDMREGVLAATAEADKQAKAGPAPEAPRPRSGFLVDLTRLWRNNPLPAGLATAAVLILAVLAGRGTPDERTLDQALLQAVDRQATPQAQTASLDSYWDSPYSFANVSVRPEASGQLALSFDVCRHVDVQVAQDSPLAREVLLSAILEPSSMGSRLRAMDVTPDIPDTRLKDALVMTMLNDPDATVRLSAATVLARYPYDRQIEDAYLHTLGQDQDVQMRLTAMQALAGQNVGQETIRNAVGDDAPEGTMAILRQAAATEF